MDLVALHEERRLRGRLLASVVATALLTAALLGLLVRAGGSRAAMPGPLTSQHGHLSDRCDACHDASLSAVQDLTHGTAPSELDLAQSRRCLGCHDLGSSPLLAHSMSSAERLERFGTTALANLERLPAGPGGELACSTCHVEHGGRGASLVDISDARCQTCHEARYSGFGAHPAFEDDYPHRRRTRLVFDHRSHIRRHFRADEIADAPTACTDCHVLDEAGIGMPVASYEQACHACHDEEIRGSTQVGGRGLPFLALPALDVLSLEESGRDIGTWAADSFLCETPLTPFMALLLAQDTTPPSGAMPGDETDLLDLTGATPVELDRVTGLASRVRDLFAEVASGGHRALLERVQAMRLEPLTVTESRKLLAGLPEDLARRATREWLASDELAAVDGSEAIFDGPGSVGDREDWVWTGGWYLDELEFSLRYRPSGHADPFLESWLDLGGSLSEALPAARTLFAELAEADAVGTCTKCHSVDGGPGDGWRVNWRGARSGARSMEGAGDLTRFAHRPHLTAPGENTCLECHVLARETDEYLDSYDQPDPWRNVSNFHPVTVSDCSDCHRPQGAPATCITCHDYHPVSTSSAGEALLKVALGTD